MECGLSCLSQSLSLTHLSQPLSQNTPSDGTAKPSSPASQPASRMLACILCNIVLADAVLALVGTAVQNDEIPTPAHALLALNAPQLQPAT